MTPGLHALECTRCGAPLDPGDSALGAIVRCRHCAQPHLWVAPDKVEAQPVPVPRQVKRSSRGPWLLVIGAGVAAVFVAGMASFVLLRGSASPMASARSLPADAPLVIGDEVMMVVRSKNSFTSCPVTVLGLEPDGRVLGVPCNGTNPTPIHRQMLEPQPLVLAESGAIALYRTATGWQRGEILGPEPGDQVRLRALGEGGSESVVARGEVLGVQRVPGNDFLPIPLPADAPVAVDDTCLVRDGSVLTEGKLLKLADTVTLEPGTTHGGRFDSFKQSNKTVSRKSLLAIVVTAGTKLEPGYQLLSPGPGGWQRLTVVVEEPHLLVKVTGPGGKEQRVVKQGLILIRVPDKEALARTPEGALPTKQLNPFWKEFRKCFNDALKQHPDAQGKVVMRIDLDARGNVTKAEATASGALPESVPKCMKERALATKVEPPAGGGGSYTVPITFVSQR